MPRRPGLRRAAGRQRHPHRVSRARRRPARPRDRAGEPDRRITVSTIHRAKGTEAQLVVLIGCEERLLPSWRALAVTRRRPARRGAAPVLRRVHPRQGPADPHPRGHTRRPAHRRPLPLPRRSPTDRPNPGARRLKPTARKGATHHEQPQPRHHDRSHRRTGAHPRRSRRAAAPAVRARRDRLPRDDQGHA